MKNVVLFICRIVIVVLFTSVLQGKNLSMLSAIGPLRASLIDLARTYRLSNSRRFLNSRKPSEVKLTINGVELGSALNQVRQRFGPPKSRRKESISDTTCSAPYTHLSLNYAGLTFGL